MFLICVGKATVVEEGDKSFIKSQRLTIKTSCLFYCTSQSQMSYFYMFNEQAQVYTANNII